MEPSLSELAFGFVPAQIVHAAAQLGVADALADGPHDLAEVADRTGTAPVALRSLLRALVGLGLVAQTRTDRFTLTEAGQPLRGDVPGSVRAQLLLATMPELWQAWGGLVDAVRTGTPARDPQTGLTAYEATLRDPVFSDAYRSARADSGRTLGAAVARACSFERFGTVADFGGDDGALIAAILAAVPSLRAVLLDTPAGVQRAAATLAAAGVADRCELVPAGPLPAAAVPAGLDAYLLNHVVRDHPDAAAVDLLRRFRAAMAPDARLLVVETVLPDVLSHEDCATYGLTDLNGLVYSGGRERSVPEYRDLLAAAGLALAGTTDVPTPGALPDYCVLEGVPTP